MSIKNVGYNEEAKTEYYTSVKYYKEIDRGLAEEFYDAVQDAIAGIKEYPDSGHPYMYNTRRVLLDRFPFAIIYRRKGDLIVILAVHHTKRKPSYWEKRIK